MKNETVIDRFFDALGRGNVNDMRACCSPDARIWHNFDCIAQDIDVATKTWAGLIKHSAERSVHDINRHVTAEGFVQQHMFVLRTAAGERKAWAACIVVKIADGLITRLEEYIDRAGSFTIAEGSDHTPGLELGAR